MYYSNVFKQIQWIILNNLEKGLLPISEYQENIEYLKEKYKFLYEEENGDDERWIKVIFKKE